MDLHNILYSPNAANIQVVINADELRKCFENFTAWGMERIKETREPEYYTREELAKRLHISEVTVYNWVSKGWLPKPVKINGRVLYDKAKVRECIDARNRQRYSR